MEMSTPSSSNKTKLKLLKCNQSSLAITIISFCNVDLRLSCACARVSGTCGFCRKRLGSKCRGDVKFS